MRKQSLFLLITGVWLLLCPVWAHCASIAPVIQIDYTVAANGTDITATATFLNENPLQNLQGVILVIDSTDITGVDNDGTYNGRPFWNMGSLLPSGSAEIQIKMTIPAAAKGTTLNFNIQIFSSLSAPIADAGSNNLAAEVSKPVVLDGSGSYDPDKNPITYRWSFHRVPAGSRFADPAINLDAADTFTPSFVPDVAGEYEVKLDVSDGSNISTDIVYILVSDPQADLLPISPPDTLKEQQAKVGELIRLDGPAYFRHRGTPTAFDWSFVKVPKESSLRDKSITEGGEPGVEYFTPDVAGRYTLKLRITYSGPGNGGHEEEHGKAPVKHRTQVKIIKIMVGGKTAKLPPIAAVVSKIVEVPVNLAVQLDGSASSDPNGDPLTYSWNLVSTPADSAASLTNPQTAMASFIPDREGFYQVILTVSDGKFTSLPCIVHVLAFDPARGLTTPGTPQAIVDALNLATPLPDAGVINITSPLQGGVYPVNMPLPVKWSSLPAAEGCEISVGYGRQTFTIKTIGNSYSLAPAILSNIAATGNGSAQITLKVKIGTQVYQTAPIFLRVTPSQLAGKIVFWGVNPKYYYWSDGVGSIYSLQMGSTQPPTAIYGSATGNFCAGCHTLSIKGEMALLESGNDYGLRITHRDGSKTAIPQIWSSVVSWNRDGTKLLYTLARVSGDFMNCDTYVFDTTTGTSAPVAGLNREDRDEVMAVWAPDDSIVAVVVSHKSKFSGNAGNNYIINTRGDSQIVHLGKDGSEKVLSAFETARVQYYPSVSPDGKWVVFNKSLGQSYSDPTAKLWIVPLDGSTTPRQIDNTNGTYLDAEGKTISYGNSWPKWSPDGAWIAFSSNRPLVQDDGTVSRDWSLYIANIDATGNGSVALPIPGASSANLSEHVQDWLP